MQNYIIKIRAALRWIKYAFPSKKEFGFCAESARIFSPMYIDNPKAVFFGDNTLIKDGLRIINSPKEKVLVKNYSVLASNVTIVTNNHVSTVSIPQNLLASSHINDESHNAIINEDVWVGTGAIILSGVELGRGSIVGAGAVVTKSVPAYAVVVGCPAQIIASKFTIDEILKHEKFLYKEDDRFSRNYLEELFNQFYINKKSLGTLVDLNDEALKIIYDLKKRYKYVEPF